VCVELGRDSWGSGGFGSSYGGARGGGPMRGDYGSRDTGPYGGQSSDCYLRQYKKLLFSGKVRLGPLRGD